MAEPQASDDRLLDDLRERVQLFLGNSRPSLRKVQVEVDGDLIILRGSVRTWHEKQLATEFSRHVAGVIRILNLLDVGNYPGNEPQTEPAVGLDVAFLPT